MCDQFSYLLVHTRIREAEFCKDAEILYEIRCFGHFGYLIFATIQVMLSKTLDHTKISHDKQNNKICKIYIYQLCLLKKYQVLSLPPLLNIPSNVFLI